MFDGHLRFITDRAVKPIGNGLSRLGVRPDHLTVLGLVMAVVAAVVIGSGHLFAGFLVLAASALPDLFDGAVAKAGKSSSVRGAFFDSTADRVTDALLLGGVAWHLQTTEGGHVAMLAFAVLGLSAVIPYMRAKAEIYGFDAKGGLMERAERIIVLGVGLVITPLLIPILWVLLVLSTITAVQRFVKIWRQADKPPVPVRPAKPVRRSWVTPSDRADRRAWRARRECESGPQLTWSERASSQRRATLMRKSSETDWAGSFAAWRDRMKQRGER